MKHKKTFWIIIKSTIFWTILALSSPFFNIFILCMVMLDVKIRHRIAIQWNYLFAFLARYLCGISYVVHGKENLPSTPAILASNHQSMWETVMFCLIFPQHVWILKKELLKIPFFGWTMSLIGPIAIDRSNHVETLQQVLRQSAKRVAKGFWILIFPEGTRVALGADKTYKPGAAKIAMALNLPIIPVAHNGGTVLPRNGFLIYPGTVTVIIDKPLYPLEGESVSEVTDRLRDIIATNLKIINKVNK